MNRHQFQLAAKKFRAGKLTLDEFTEQTWDVAVATESPSKPSPVAAIDCASLAGIRARLERRADAHKGHFGRCLLLGGSRSMPGAIALSALAAMRSGAGLVTVATVESARIAVQGFSPTLMCESVPEDENGMMLGSLAPLESRLAWANVLAIGPGLGQNHALPAALLELLERRPEKLVIDADGLNILAQLIHSDAQPPTSAPLLKDAILTPHEGEFLRLLGLPASGRDPQGQPGRVSRAELEQRASEFANRWQCTLVLKGHRTLVTDGQRTWHNDAPNPGLATAGSGDVLTGILVALLGQRLSPWDAALAGVQWHSAAGKLAAQRRGVVSMLATDIIEALGPALA